MSIPRYMLFLLSLAACATTHRSPADAGISGKIGECGLPGADGTAGSMNVDALYPLYPLCNVASLIVSANDATKLREFLSASCDVTKPALPGSASPLWDLAIARQRTDLLEIILSRPEVVARINLYDPIDPRILRKDGINAPLNPFEIAVYSQVLAELNSGDSSALLKNLYVDGKHVSMLNLLLNASFDREKLQRATSRIMRDIGDSSVKDPCNGAALGLIRNRLQELSR